MLRFLVGLLAFASIANSRIIPLNSFDQEGMSLKVGKSSRIYVISIDSKENLQSLRLVADTVNTTGYELSIPQADGSLTPLIPTSDNSVLDVSSSTPVFGWLYINSITPTLNVFPLVETTSVQSKLGTNVFFKMINTGIEIPVVQNLVTDGTSSQQLTGFAGLPDETTPLKFFDSTSIPGVTTYNQLDIPIEKFHLVSNNGNIKYQVKFSTRSNMTIGSAGLIMTYQFPTGTHETNDYNLENSKGINVDAFLVPRLGNSPNPYSGNVTLLMTTDQLQPTVFPMYSSPALQIASNITANSPISRIVVESDGPYSLQYFLRDTTVTTPSPFESTTKSSNVYKVISALIVTIIFRF